MAPFICLKQHLASTKNTDLYLIPVSLAGDDNGRFAIDNETGEITLTRRVENRLLMPTYTMRIMVRLPSRNLYSVDGNVGRGGIMFYHSLSTNRLLSRMTQRSTLWQQHLCMFKLRTASNPTSTEPPIKALS